MGQPLTEAAALSAMTLVDGRPESHLAPLPGDPLRLHYTQWMFHLFNAVQRLFRQWWYPHEAAGPAQADAVRQHVIPRIEAAWDRIEGHLAEHGPYLLGTKPSAADFYLTMLMRWAAECQDPDGLVAPRRAGGADEGTASFKPCTIAKAFSEWA